MEEQSESQSSSSTTSESSAPLLPTDMFNPFRPAPHHFTVGMRMEALHPVTERLIAPVKIIRVFSNNFVHLAFDDFRQDAETQEPVRLLHFTGGMRLLPANWCGKYCISYISTVSK